MVAESNDVPVQNLHIMKKYKRDRRGRFISYRPLMRLFFGVSLVYMVSMIGLNTIWGWAKSLETVLEVENTEAEEIITTPTLREEVTMMLREAGIDVEAALKIADYESWFREDNFHVNTKGLYAGTIDRGLWMLSDYFYANVSDECAYDGICATIQAIRIMKTRDFNEWTCYKKHLCR